jgi:hypothetical protein
VLVDQRGRARQAKRTATPSAAPVEPRWLLLFHQIPPSPAYLRVKVGRQLARVGALPLKNTVYILPRSEGTFEDLQWVSREVTASGGEATLCEARFVAGLTDAELERRFQDARDQDYAALAEELRSIAEDVPVAGPADPEARNRLEADLVRFERRLEESAAIDFFNAPGREAPVGLLEGLRARLRHRDVGDEDRGEESQGAFRGKVWVTRAGVHVDRIASAWLIRRCVDASASFKFVPPRGYRPEKNEVRFDMFEAEFTHEGDLCTFEVLLKRLSIREAGLVPIAEIIHDIDLKDSKFQRPEAAGVAATIAGICIASRSDEERLEQGFALFDQLRAYFSRRKRSA